MGPWIGDETTVALEFFDEQSGALTDPTAVQVDITYGSQLGSGAPTVGTFTYQGSATPSSSQVYRTGTGQYALDWEIPNTAAPGVYVMNWTCTFNGDQFLGVENITVGLPTPGVPGTPVDVGYWTGSLASADGSVAVPLGGIDANGTAWVLHKVEGWDGVDTVGSVAQYATDHGGIPTVQYYAPRMITLTISAGAATQAARDQARALLQQAVEVSDLGTFVYDEPIPKQALVRRSGRISETYQTLADVQFNVLLVAPDPRKYSVVMHALTATSGQQQGGLAPPWTPPITPPAQPPPGYVVATNAGNVETRPTVTVTGPVTAPVIYNQTTGEAISFSQLTLDPTDVLTLDLATRTATLNGSPRVADLYSAWWVMPPGTTVVQLLGSGDSSGSSITVSWRDAWM